MKKQPAMISLLCLLFTLLLAGCSPAISPKDDPTPKKLSIVSTIFPGYDFAKQVTKADANIRILLPPGSESHSYEPSPKDIQLIQNCDLFIYVGGESETWVKEILDSLDRPIKTLKMIEVVRAVSEQWVEGMEEEEEEEDHDDQEQEALDEHVWTSPQNAIIITKEISKQLQEIDPAKKSIYETHTTEYIQQLERLDQDFKDLFSSVQRKTLIIGDRFPFRYFTDAYDLPYYAAFNGCSTKGDASPTTLKFLMEKVKETNSTTVFYIEMSNQHVANAIAEETKVKTALLHSVHNVTPQEQQQGFTYISLMQQNLQILKEALQ